MIVLTEAQGTDDWLQSRAGLATASEFGAVMGTKAARATYRAKLLIERLTGQPAESYQSQAMAWGSETEGLARLMYQLATGNEVEQVGFCKHDTLEAGASPDGLIGTDGVLEIKCPNTATAIETLKTEKIPSKYYWQMMGQLFITSRKWADYVSFDPRLPANARMVIIRVERNEDDIAALEANLISFEAELQADLQFIQTYKGGHHATHPAKH